MTNLVPIVALVIGTFASEDLTCIAAGQLVGRGEIRFTVAVAGCFLGIFVGDVGLWLLGRVLGARVLRLPWLSRRLPAHRLKRLGGWFDRHALRAVLASRFLPGTRVPLYVAAGTLGRSGVRFMLAAMLAALVWTPLIVLLAAAFGDRLARRFLGTGWIAFIVAAVTCLTLLHLIRLLSTDIGRAKLVAGVSRLWRWEFWPTWLFYVPLVPWIAWLSLRHRGFATITAANPGILHGGFVGESKHQILSSLRSPHVLPTALLDATTPEARLGQLDRAMQGLRIEYPLILKPDVGQRGAGVTLVHTRDAASEHFARTGRIPLLVQPYHPGPFEAGIFYYRLPHEPRGRIFSITDKHFADLVGDGVSTIEQLVWRHPRYRMQARMFLARHDGARVLGPGERLRLAVAGNHSQGTLFRDGAHLLTPALEHAIDRVAQSFSPPGGFRFGRFDVRYSDADAFRRGEDLAIVELNGVTSESTNIYDPARSLLSAYRTLFAQWSLLFRIAAANRRAGRRPSSLMHLVHGTVAHYFHRHATATVD